MRQFIFGLSPFGTITTIRLVAACPFRKAYPTCAFIVLYLSLTDSSGTLTLEYQGLALTVPFLAVILFPVALVQLNSAIIILSSLDVLPLLFHPALKGISLRHPLVLVTVRLISYRS